MMLLCSCWITWRRCSGKHLCMLYCAASPHHSVQDSISCPEYNDSTILSAVAINSPGDIASGATSAACEVVAECLGTATASSRGEVAQRRNVSWSRNDVQFLLIAVMKIDRFFKIYVVNDFESFCADFQHLINSIWCRWPVRKCKCH